MTTRSQRRAGEVLFFITLNKFCQSCTGFGRIPRALINLIFFFGRSAELLSTNDLSSDLLTQVAALPSFGLTREVHHAAKPKTRKADVGCRAQHPERDVVVKKLKTLKEMLVEKP